MTQSLAALVETTCGALDRMPVRITGAWKPRASLSGGWTRHEWHGVAGAAAPMVALLCVCTGDEVAWYKSGRSKLPAGPTAALSAGTPAQAPASIHALDLRLAITVAPDHPLVGLDARVQGAQANVTTGDLPGRPPADTPVLDILAERATTTGIVFDLADVPATPHVAFSLLFLTGAQVEMGRNHLWRVRRALSPLLDEPLRSILGHGRRGTLHATAQARAHDQQA
jgi:hypothetical protein